MSTQVPVPIFRQEEWFRYIVGADSQPTGGPLNRLEEWYAWMASMLMPKSGGTMTGPLNMDGNAITGLPQTTDSDAAVSFGQVEAMIEAVAGIYRGAFATYAALTAVQWQTTDPTAANYVTNNDWAVVLDDETHSDQCWRYGYTVGVGWQAQFKINDTPLSQAQIDAINSGITAALLSAILGNFAEEYDATATYAVGDCCVHEGGLYQCSTAITTAEAWNASHWTAKSVAELFSVNGVFPCTYGTTTFDQIDAAITAGKLPVCKYNGKLYICTGYSTVNLASVVRFGCVEVSTLLGGTAAIGYFLSCSESNDTWSADTINLVDSAYLSNQSYATETYVDTAIGGAIGGSY